MRKWLAVMLAGTMLIAGCTGGGGGGGGGQQSPQASPQPSSDEIRRAVTAALHDPDMKDFLRTSVRTQAGNEMLSLALDTQDGQTTLHDAVRRSLTSGVGQQAITSKVAEMVNDPTVKTHLHIAIRDTLNEILSRGAAGLTPAGGGKDTKGGKDKNKDKGGDQSGGGGGGGDGGGGGKGGGGGGGGGT